MKTSSTTTRKLPAAEISALKKLVKQAAEAAHLLNLLGNEKRLLILCFLTVRGEMTVGELVDAIEFGIREICP